MYILDVMETCSSPALSSVLPVVKTILLIIQIVVPVTLLVASTIELVKLSINPEDKDGFRKILNKVIAAIIVFILPVLMNVIMGVVGESTTFSDCWNNASDNPFVGGSYISNEDE